PRSATEFRRGIAASRPGGGHRPWAAGFAVEHSEHGTPSRFRDLRLCHRCFGCRVQTMAGDSLILKWRNQETRDFKSLAEWWTDRAGRAAKTLHMWGNTRRFGAIMRDKIPRWSNLNLAMDALIAEKYLHTAQTLPFLQTMKLRLLYNDDDDDIQDCLSIFSNAPALHTVHLYGRVHSTMYIFSWYQLMNFLGNTTTSINVCRCLTNAGDPIHISTKTPFPPNFVLESLTLSNADESNRDDGVYQQIRLLDFLTTPALQELTTGFVWDSPPLIRFLFRCSPPLHKMRLSLEKFETRIFHLSPRLVSLDLTLYDPDGTEFSNFSRRCTLPRPSSPSSPPATSACANARGPRSFLGLIILSLSMRSRHGGNRGRVWGNSSTLPSFSTLLCLEGRVPDLTRESSIVCRT
ncbi:hypothetical protein C8R44DRAFT_927201, partial [Mycena epipterygia]